MYKYFLKIFLFFLFFATLLFQKPLEKAKPIIDNTLLTPTKYIKITSYFGYRTFKGYKPHLHNGIDLANKQGTPVYAAQSGIVSFARFNGAYGFTILLTHDKNLKTMYCHLDPKFNVYPGQNVSKGDLIGWIGPSILKNSKEYYWFQGAKRNGMTTGPHLHFTVIENGKYVNPLKYIKK